MADPGSDREVPPRTLVQMLLAAAAVGLLVGQGLGTVAPGLPEDPDSAPPNPPPASAWTPTEAPDGPNILIILTDDQRYDTLHTMPRTQRLLFEEGVAFPNAFVTTPVCCPSRASVLTGLYAHHHGVQTNHGVLWDTTVAQRLQQAGYHTGLVGKYLNTWDGTNRSEFDHWVSFEYGDVGYHNPSLVIGDEKRRVDGYVTDLLRDAAIEFLSDAIFEDRPFFLLFAPNAPHRPADPAPGDERLFEDEPWDKPPSYDEADVSDKPAWIQAKAPLNESQESTIEDTRLGMLRSQVALDRAVAAVLHKLDRYHGHSDTLVIFLSDNGFFWGEHRLWGKGAPYEEAVRVPMAVWYPPLTDGKDDSQAVVSNIDIVPTIYDLAGIDPPDPVDGRSLVDLFSGSGSWRDGILLEGWSGETGAWTAAHTGSAVHIRYANGSEELYDLKADPYQLANLAGDPSHRTLENRLAALHEELLTSTGYPGSPEASTPAGGGP